MKIALLGYGKMGKEIERIALERKHHIVLKMGVENLADLTPENLSKADVAIEFSTPESAVENIKKCFDANVPVVIGTTGWLNNLEEVKKRCLELKQAMLWASNFSVGVNLFFELNKQLAQLMNNQFEYDVELEETHHIHKLDAPSGTAITLAEDIINNLERKSSWKKETAEKSSDLVIQSHRIENVPGTHLVKYSSKVDDIQITHTAHSREGFALGAVIASEWIAGKTGIFSMRDVLKIN
ncbi:MAG: 4-hydroxy-tetrahydrodipicolinate reductase [Bacteroidetes bacterium]|nr:4-hydroxy-tetrahydrodipicolinate reductase [Bacteroidota bacterium]HET6244380.1 4-hydroxy-tetrahydrodipicolinate reductase [Bacteroidia bacterium]